jgi:hypothetical protein
MEVRKLVGMQCGFEFAPMFPSGRQRFGLNRLIQLDQLSPPPVPPVVASIKGNERSCSGH